MFVGLVSLLLASQLSPHSSYMGSDRTHDICLSPKKVSRLRHGVGVSRRSQTAGLIHQHTKVLGHSDWFEEKNNTGVSMRVKEANEQKAGEQCLADGMHSTPIHYYHHYYCAE